MCIASAGFTASAQSESAPRPADLAQRREFIEIANRASASGDHPRALEFYERAGQIQMSATLRSAIADEQNSLHLVVDALGSAQQCLVDFAQLPSPLSADRSRALAVCRRIRDELQAVVGHVTITVPNPPPEGLRIRVGDRELARTFWNAPFLVAPGELRIVAEAPDHRPFVRSVQVDPGRTPDVGVTLEATPSERPASGAPSGGSSARPAVHAPPGVPSPSSGPSPFPLNVPGWLAVGLGGAGLTLGVVGAIEQHALSVLYSTPPPPPAITCPPNPPPGAYSPGGLLFGNIRCRELYNTMTTWSTAEIVGFVAGGVLLVSGGVLLFLSVRNHSHEPARHAAMWACLPEGMGLSCAGTF